MYWAPAHAGRTEGEVWMYAYARRLPVVEEIDVLVCGAGCAGIGATSEAAASSRVTITAMGMGQGAGVAAALPARGNIAPEAVSILALQQHLRAQGALLD